MVARVIWDDAAAKKIARAAALKALRDGAESILTDAIDLAPIETGTMRRSGQVTEGQLPDAASIFQMVNEEGRKNMQKLIEETKKDFRNGAKERHKAAKATYKKIFGK